MNLVGRYQALANSGSYNQPSSSPHIYIPPSAMDHNDFDSVSWRNDGDSDPSRPATSYTDIDNASSSRDDPNGKRRISSTGDEVLSPVQDGAFAAALDNGMLECTVDTPLKEKEGTKDVYVSYLVSTHVSVLAISSDNYTYRFNRPISNPFKRLTSAFEGASRTFIFFTIRYFGSILLAPSLHCRINTRWNTYAGIDSGQSSPSVVPGLFTGLSRELHSILSYVELQSWSLSLNPENGINT